MSGRPSMKLVALAALPPCILLGCAFDRELGDLPDTEAQAEFRKACEGAAKRADSCGEPALGAATCTAAEACLRASVRDEAEHVLLTCLAEGRCGVDCGKETAASLAPTPAAAAHRARCSTWRCTGLDVRSDLCRDFDWGAPFWAVFDDALFDAVAPCFELPCSEFDACVEGRLVGRFPECSLDGACAVGPLEASGGLVTPCFGSPRRPDPSIILLRAPGNDIVDVASGVTVVNKGVGVDGTRSKFGRSFKFQGGSRRLTIPDMPMLNFGKRDFTVELWFYPLNSGTLMVKRANGRDYGAFDLFGSIGLYVSSAGGHWDVAYAAPYGWDLGRWQHVAVVRHGEHIFTYHDGVLTTTLDIYDREIKTVPDDLSIGNELDSSYPFIGNMEEIRIVDGLAVYAGEFPPPDGPF